MTGEDTAPPPPPIAASPMPVPAPDPRPALRVADLYKSYAGVTALHGIGFEVAPGEIIGLLGPNGAGKSTTLRILAGLLPADSGLAEVCGVDVAENPAAAGNMLGFMPENNPLPEDLRVREYLHLRGRLKGLTRRRLAPRLDEVVHLCDLGRVRDRLIGALSKGYRQRVGIADAILAEPPVVVLDEPTIGLDPLQILSVRDLIAGLRSRMTVLISSHILPEIEATCDRVLIINQGRVAATGTPAELRRRFFGDAFYQIELAGPPDELPALLGSVSPSLVLAAPPEVLADGFHRLRVSGPAATDHREELARAFAADPRYRLRDLTRIRPSLEQVFLAATHATA